MPRNGAERVGRGRKNRTTTAAAGRLLGPSKPSAPIDKKILEKRKALRRQIVVDMAARLLPSLHNMPALQLAALMCQALRTKASRVVSLQVNDWDTLLADDKFLEKLCRFKDQLLTNLTGREAEVAALDKKMANERIRNNAETHANTLVNSLLSDRGAKRGTRGRGGRGGRGGTRRRGRGGWSTRGGRGQSKSPARRTKAAAKTKAAAAPEVAARPTKRARHEPVADPLNLDALAPPPPEPDIAPPDLAPPPVDDSAGRLTWNPMATMAHEGAGAGAGLDMWAQSAAQADAQRQAKLEEERLRKRQAQLREADTRKLQQQGAEELLRQKKEKEAAEAAKRLQEQQRRDAVEEERERQRVQRRMEEDALGGHGSDGASDSGDEFFMGLGNDDDDDDFL